MAEYDNELNGVAYWNDYKKLPKQPSYRGTLQIDGVQYKQAVWEKVSKNGKKYLSFSYEKVDDQPKESQSSSADSNELDDFVPF